MEIDYKELGQRIRLRRMEIGYTQQLLAELSEITPQYMAEIENSRKKVSLSVLANLAERLELTVDELLHGEDRSEGRSYVADFELLLDDCSPAEGRVLYEAGRALKRVLVGIRC